MTHQSWLLHFDKAQTETSVISWPFKSKLFAFCVDASARWSRRPGRPRNRWVDQIRRDDNLAPANLWRRAVRRGHRGATLRPVLAMR